MMNVTDILKAKNINRTDIREKILGAMLYKGPVSQREIGRLVNFDINRITLYRTLREFINKKIIVRIHDDKGEEKFFINYGDKKDHIHFKCSVCNHLFSFPEKAFPFRSLPKGFKVKEKKLFITGICNKCNDPLA